MLIPDIIKVIEIIYEIKLLKQLQRKGIKQVESIDPYTSRTSHWKVTDLLKYYQNEYKRLEKDLIELRIKRKSLKGGKKYIHIPNVGKRLIRHYKNGKSYVMINKKKVKL